MTAFNILSDLPWSVKKGFFKNNNMDGQEENEAIKKKIRPKRKQ